MVNRIILNETSYFGRGGREKLATEIESRNFRKVLLVTDNALMVTAWYQEVNKQYLVLSTLRLLSNPL